MERSPQTLILDASTGTKWFVEDEDSDKALVLRDGDRKMRMVPTSPDLLPTRG